VESGYKEALSAEDEPAAENTVEKLVENPILQPLL
jgi:hypothetical protein